jgi:hypothetical protein
MLRNNDGKTIVERRSPSLLPILLLLSLLPFFCCSDDDDDEEEEEVDEWCNRVLVLWRTSNPNVVVGCCCSARCFALTSISPFVPRRNDVVVTPGIIQSLVGVRSSNILSCFISMEALLVSKMMVLGSCRLDGDVNSKAGRVVAVCKKARASTPGRPPQDSNSNKTATIVTTRSGSPGVPPLCLVVVDVGARRRRPAAIENMIRQSSLNDRFSPCDILLSIVYCWDRLVFLLIVVAATQSFVLLCCAGDDVFGIMPASAGRGGPGDDASARSKHILAPGWRSCIESQCNDSRPGLDRLRWNILS